MVRPSPFILAAGLLAVGTSSAVAQRGDALSDSAIIGTIAVRSIGPAVMSGRVSDIAVAESPGTRGGALGNVIYIAAATGGIWKSTNAGMSWEPILDDAGVGGMGAVAVAPSNSNIVWAGSGEANNMRSSSYGDGVYKSVDGGASFTHMGLRTSQHIGRIAIHPEDHNTVFVASVGPLWSGGGERGLFKSTDGGDTWTNVLDLGQYAGVTDVAIDRSNPEIMYAAALQRERRAYSYLGGGPSSGIYKSTDGGDTWREVTTGLPDGDMGRIGLSIVASQPRTVYAIIEGTGVGSYRSDDYGETWTKTSSISSIPWYFGQIRADPNDPDVVYHLGVQLQRSEDGGENWSRVGGGPHVDHHAMWINPENSNHIVLGNDGGLYVSRDYAASWDFSPNLPISQFYAVGLDMAEPFFGVYGGLQDNSTWGGPSRTKNSMGIVNAEWYRMAGGDGFWAAIDPTDDNIAYVESQNGNLIRFDKRTGDRKPIRPQPEPGEDAYRYNWSAPIRISPFDNRTIYFAANFVFKSTDRGDSWTKLGEDLTRAIDRDSLPMQGAIPARNAVARHQGTAVFSNISAMDVSTLRPGLIATGSDDGMIAVSVDDGLTWNRMTDFPGVPDTTYVSDVIWSRHNEGTLYASLDGHRSNDFRPYVLRSTDHGNSWENISSNLPAFGNIRSFAEHHGNPNVLFAGSEVAPFVSVDGGESWTRIRNGMPPSPVHDLAVHPRDNALVIATHGRGFYIIDDLGPIEHLAEARAAEKVYLMPVVSPIAYVPNSAPTQGTHATRTYSASNPPVGTTISYLVTGSISGDMTLEIVGGNGDVVRELRASKSRGLRHVRWNLRTDPPYAGPREPAANRQGGGNFGGGGGPPSQGPMAIPGEYMARLTIEGDSGPHVIERAFTVRKDENVVLTNAQLARLFELRQQVGELQARLDMASRTADRIKEQVDQAEDAMELVDDLDESVKEMAEQLGDDIDDVIKKLRGAPRRPGQGGGSSDEPPAVRQRLQAAAGVNRATAMPTARELSSLEAVPDALDAEVARLNEMLTERMPAFFRALDAAGVPWTPGRPIR